MVIRLSLFLEENSAEDRSYHRGDFWLSKYCNIKVPVHMARKRGKKTVASSPGINAKAAVGNELQNEKQEDQFTDPDVERQISAIKAIRDVEIEHVLTKLHLLRSYYTKEQRQTPVLYFFKENFPNLSFVNNEEHGHMQLQWINEDGKVSINDGTDLHLSLLHQLSMAHSGCQALGGFEFSSKAEKSRFLSADNLQIRDVVSGQRLSIGVTPKTLRLPKPGETLLSVHGSPLGVYKEDNMEAIHELEEGSLGPNYIVNFFFFICVGNSQSNWTS